MREEVLDLEKFPNLKRSVDAFAERIRSQELEHNRQRLLKMIEHRFGAVPARVAARIRKADSDEVAEFLTRVKLVERAAEVVR